VRGKRSTGGVEEGEAVVHGHIEGVPGVLDLFVCDRNNGRVSGHRKW
jgi:hypothetical protein